MNNTRLAHDKALTYSLPFGLSLSKPLIFKRLPFDKLRENGLFSTSRIFRAPYLTP